jgi:hypothetical protein
MTWVLQAELRDRAFLADLVATLAVLGETALVIPVVPRSTELPPLPAEVEAGPIVCYGPRFVPRVLDHAAWRPGIFFDRNAFRWSVMRAQWGTDMFAEDGYATTLADALALVADAPRFVRPDADDKLFDGGVHDLDSLRAAIGDADRGAPVIVGSQRPVDAEWRCFVVGGEVIDGSEYRRAGRPSLHRGIPPRVIELVETAASRWTPASVVCIDVASSGDRFGIVEANCFNASRFYAADTATVVAAVTQFASSSVAG